MFLKLDVLLKIGVRNVARMSELYAQSLATTTLLEELNKY